ncbi:adenylyltransferase/cytidyltransferase family protein [Methanobacterium paludis]|uniref:adenylyltransferase/cytidyltransferase family protein n=1 Tax=Methanobacterium paludis (strain DSM 25820 / JCM 18151 / SWAN1) TaxID=868131 RepID=UPI001D0FE2FE|nr:adenylyltransferase/cytidyltransferase family protein [Methanobacterium paludis]
MSADFDPVHKGHVKLIDKARQLADKKGDEVVIYLNKGYSANHAPFFANFNARSRMALEAGADRIVPIEGLHHRLTLAYTVPIRIAMMIEDGVVDYVDAADVSTDKIKKYSSSFAKKGIFSGIPRNLPNRNVIRWFAVNEFLYKKYNRKLKFHIIPEYKIHGEKISGRFIRREIIENNMEIPESAAKLLPDSTVQILEEELKKGNIPGERNITVLTKRLNTYSRAKMINIAHMNADAVSALVKGRKYTNEDQIWASLRMAGYGPVLTRLVISAAEEDVTRREVFDLIKKYEKDGIIPPDQKVENVIERAWFVASKSDEGMPSSDAHKMFRKGVRIHEKPLYTFDGGMHLRSFEIPSLEDGMDATLYVDKNDRLCCDVRAKDRKIKSPLKLPAKLVTYLRLLIDSQFIPLSAQLVEKEEGWRIRVFVGDYKN